MTKKSLPNFFKEEAFLNASVNTYDTIKEKSSQAFLSPQSIINNSLSRMTKAELEVKVRKLTKTLDQTNQQVNDIQISLN
ncbi:MAG: hypothetical protein ACQJCO_06325 [cyanobacterium endosymbiont of Rhopalodia sterrenbergii]